MEQQISKERKVFLEKQDNINRRHEAIKEEAQREMLTLKDQLLKALPLNKLS